jgi:hypothetical protein
MEISRYEKMKDKIAVESYPSHEELLNEIESIIKIIGKIISTSKS